MGQMGEGTIWGAGVSKPPVLLLKGNLQTGLDVVSAREGIIQNQLWYRYVRACKGVIPGGEHAEMGDLSKMDSLFVWDYFGIKWEEVSRERCEAIVENKADIAERIEFLLRLGTLRIGTSSDGGSGVDLSLRLHGVLVDGRSHATGSTLGQVTAAMAAMQSERLHARTGIHVRVARTVGGLL